MKVEVSELTACKREMLIEAPVEDVKKEFDKNISEYQKTAQIKGFRPGKVPVKILLIQYGESVMEKTAEDMINNLYRDVCKEKQIVPASRASMSDVSYGIDKPLKFKVTFEIEPEIELKEYTGLGIVQDKVKLTDKDVDAVLDDLRERMATFDKVDRTSKKGDYIKYTHEKVIVDNKERTDYRDQTYPMPVGEAKIKEINKALIGVKAGEIVNVKFKFPKDYEAEEVREKDADFTFKITEVLEKKLPELNDDFAKKIGQYKDIEEMKVKIKEELKNTRESESKKKVEAGIFDAIIAKNEIPIPESRVEAYTENMLQEMEKYNKTLDRSKVIDSYRKMALDEIKKYRIIEWVAKKENIKGTKEEVDAKIKKIAEERKENFEELKEKLRKDGTTLTMRSDLRYEKTIDWLIEKNKK